MAGSSFDNLIAMQSENALAQGRSLPNISRAQNLRQARKVAQ